MITGAMMKMLEAFHHRIGIRIMGKMVHRVGEAGWYLTLVEEAAEAAGS